MRLGGKIALVTGAGKGIGKGLARELAREGADVAITYTASAKGAGEIVAEMQELGRRAFAVRADLSKYADAVNAIRATAEHFGRIDILVNNSGITDPHPFLEITEETYDQTLDINLKGLFFCAQEAAKAMIRQGNGGRIINISSVHAFHSFPKHAHYAASKGGINSFTSEVSLELAPYGITVNAVAPGMIEVEKYPDLIANYDPAEWGPTIPLGRVGYPVDIAKMVVFFASDDADWITGQVIVVDGGMLCRSPHYAPSPLTTYPNYRRR